jgi:PKD repeat protein
MRLAFKFVNCKMKYFLSILICSLLYFNISAQSTHQHSIDLDNCRDGENVEYCKTHKLMSQLKKDKAKYQIYLKEQKQLKEIEKNLSNSKSSKVVYKIPLVFHVLHNNGSENISDEQIFDAVSILNRDFRLQNTDANYVQSVFSGMPADIQVEFALAKKAPNGQCFSGITRSVSTLTNDGSSGSAQVNAIISGNDVYNSYWPGNKYLNIFVVNEADGAAGYTTNPSIFTGSAMTNGIWVLNDYVGSIGTSDNNSSRTLTHEVGHWLNLEHTWGPNNNPGNSSSCSDDDFVDDTPRCIGVTSCNLTSNSCSNDYVDGYWSSNVVDNVENYMDYSYCSKMFTSGQKSRMRAALVSSVGSRNNHWTTSNHIATGINSPATACAVSIYTDVQEICSGDNLQFFDQSYSNITTWNWSFPGGNPSTSTQENPTITYSNLGTYDVTLQVSDALGNSVSKTFTNYINVTGGAGNYTPYSESFENVVHLSNSDWTYVNSSGPGFQVISNVASDGNKCVKLDNSQGTSGDIDELISDPIDLSNLGSASFSFKYAFAKRNNSNTDYLRVLASFNCGQSWILRKYIPSSVIGSRNNTYAPYTPSGSDWVTINVPGISNAYLVENFRFKFEFKCGGGNDLFIDEINLSGPLSIDENSIIKDFNVYPNPGNDLVKLSFTNLENINNATIQLLDASGRVVKDLLKEDFSEGNYQLEFNVADIESGWYFIRLDSPARQKSVKFIKK